MANKSEKMLNELKKLSAAFIAIDPMLSRLMEAGQRSECAELAKQKFNELLGFLRADPPGLWAIVCSVDGEWYAAVYEHLEVALEDYDPDAGFLCAAKVKDGELWLAWGGRYHAFEAIPVYEAGNESKDGDGQWSQSSK